MTAHTISRIKRWGVLLGSFAFLWWFAVGLGPWIYNQVPVLSQMVGTIEEGNIESGAYYYTEIKASSDGEQYLRRSLQTAAPDEFGFTLPFISGIVICLIILALGYRFMPGGQQSFNTNECPDGGVPKDHL